jgi:starch synthase
VDLAKDPFLKDPFLKDPCLMGSLARSTTENQESSATSSKGPDVKIFLATSEATPFAKTGGLADVCGALPAELKRLGADVSVIMPAYRQVFDAGIKIEPTDVRFDVPIGGKIVEGQLLSAHLPESSVCVYFVDQPDYFDRAGLYAENGVDYDDNAERFIFFSRAVLEAVRGLNLFPDVIHTNDWQCGLIPALLRAEYRHSAGFENIATLQTIHNMAYQGSFWHWDMLLTGLDWRYFNWREMEFHGRLNLLKTGLVFSDAISTVSPTYAREIRESDLGCGMEGLLQHRADSLAGIVNGVDYAVWNPKLDGHIAENYGIANWKSGKSACKAALQEQLGLPVKPHVPLLGVVGRLASQKGWDLMAEVMGRWAITEDAQWVILGTGDPQFEELIGELSRHYPTKISATLGFSDALAHQIEAGSDLFLMPSQYEPCGLNQLYSLKYGTVPLVRQTGGLADTVVDADPSTIANDMATGFTFVEYDAYALESALYLACRMYREDPGSWETVVETGMKQDWSWAASAKMYLNLYQQIVQRIANPALSH